MNGSDAVRIVFVLDRQRLRSQMIDRIIAECGARPHWAEDYSAIEEIGCSGPGSIVLIALEECPSSGALVLNVIRAFKQKGFGVICYAENAQSWTLGKQCSVLLEGSLCLLDSAETEFVQKLKRTLAQLLCAEAERRHKEEQIKGTMRELGIIGESPAMISIFRWVLRVSALSDLPALITGETGTGKELLVKAICRLDQKRCHGPLIALNCSAISPSLAESELFGHRRGAFTGADRDRKGLIRAAQGGILFLDEIGDLDHALQVKLLRVLQENRVLGVGEDHEVPVSVRVIAASNRNLEEMVRRGTSAQTSFTALIFCRFTFLRCDRDRPTSSLSSSTF